MFDWSSASDAEKDEWSAAVLADELADQEVGELEVWQVERLAEVLAVPDMKQAS